MKKIVLMETLSLTKGVRVRAKLTNQQELVQKILSPMIELDGITTNPKDIADAADRLLNESISPEEAFKETGATNSAIMEKAKK